MSERYKLLLVEDDLVDQMAFQRLVQRERLPYDTILATSLADARLQLQTQAFDIVVMDYSLGDGQSSELFALLADIPFIMTTASGNEDIAVTAMKAGAYDYLPKDPEGNYLKLLPLAIRKTIELWRAEQELAQYRLRLEELVVERTADLVRERNLLRTLIDHLPDYIFVKDRNGRFIVSNEAHAAAARTTPEAIIGRTALEVFDEGLALQFHADDEFVMQNEIALINEERVTTDPFGGKRCVLTTKVPLFDIDGSLEGLVGISRDITGWRMMEHEGRALNERLRVVIASAPILLFELDQRGVIQLMEGQAGESLGLRAVDLIGRSVFGQPHPIISQFADLFERAQGGRDQTHLLRIEDRALEVNLAARRSPGGDFLGVIGVATDITARFFAEQERLEAERMRIELEQQRQVIDLKERFIATATHDFRTPMTIIQMAANMLLDYGDRMPPERREERLRAIQTQVRHMTDLVDDVLTVSKANAGKLETALAPVRLRAFCERIWDDFVSLYGHTHHMTFDYQVGREWLSIDEGLMQQVLVNLLSNAIKYTPQGKRVRFEVANTPDAVVLRVVDEGIGIPPEDQAHLFQAFHRASNARKIEGTGLGLTIVKSYVEAHGGAIHFESNNGVGTTFSIVLPAR